MFYMFYVCFFNVFLFYLFSNVYLYNTVLSVLFCVNKDIIHIVPYLNLILHVSPNNNKTSGIL